MAFIDKAVSLQPAVLNQPRTKSVAQPSSDGISPLRLRRYASKRRGTWLKHGAYLERNGLLGRLSDGEDYGFDSFDDGSSGGYYDWGGDYDSVDDGGGAYDYSNSQVSFADEGVDFAPSGSSDNYFAGGGTFDFEGVNQSYDQYGNPQSQSGFVSDPSDIVQGTPTRTLPDGSIITPGDLPGLQAAAQLNSGINPFTGQPLNSGGLLDSIGNALKKILGGGGGSGSGASAGGAGGGSAPKAQAALPPATPKPSLIPGMSNTALAVLGIGGAVIAFGSGGRSR
jgi:hypothetical protein